MKLLISLLGLGIITFSQATLATEAREEHKNTGSPVVNPPVQGVAETPIKLPGALTLNLKKIQAPYDAQLRAFLQNLYAHLGTAVPGINFSAIKNLRVLEQPAADGKSKPKYLVFFDAETSVRTIDRGNKQNYTFSIEVDTDPAHSNRSNLTAFPKENLNAYAKTLDPNDPRIFDPEFPTMKGFNAIKSSKDLSSIHHLTWDSLMIGQGDTAQAYEGLKQLEESKKAPVTPLAGGYELTGTIQADFKNLYRGDNNSDEVVNFNIVPSTENSTKQTKPKPKRR